MHVSLTGKAAWQLGGPTPLRVSWETVECSCGLCQTGRFVAVDEVVEGYGQRHIAKTALRQFHPFGTDAFPPVQAYAPVARKNERRSRHRGQIRSSVAKARG